jgi:hypothetical protein
MRAQQARLNQNFPTPSTGHPFQSIVYPLRVGRAIT